MQGAHIKKLIEFSELHKNFMQSRKPSESEKRLFEINEEFKKEHPEIKLNVRSNVIDKRTFAAHGTNAWALFSAFAFTNGQLLPKNEMKVRGIPVVAGELIHEKNRCSPGSHYPNTVSQNAVSTIGLHTKSSHSFDTLRYAEMAIENHNYDYNHFSKKHLNQYQKRSTDRSIIEKARMLLNDRGMQEAYKRLSDISVVVLGDRIGGSVINSSIDNEYGCKRFNIRVIIVSEEDKEYIRNLVNEVNPKIAEDIVYLNIEEITSLEYERIKIAPNKFCSREIWLGEYCISVPINFKDSFANDFEKTFKEKLTFSFSDQFNVCQIEKKDLVKKTIKGKFEISTATITYYQNPDLTSGTIIDDVDYSVVFTESLQKQSSGISSRRWTIGLALLFGAVGATLVAIGIIPEIAAIGIIATVVLLGIASAALGGVVGYLTDITVNNFHSEATMKVA